MRGYAGVWLTLLASAPALAQTSGVPANVLVMPSAPAPPRATLNEPGGSAAYAAALPRETPPDEQTRDTVAPVASFDEALARAYWTRPALLAQRARLRSADYRLPQAKALSGPSLSYEAAYGYLRTNSELIAGKWIERQGWTSTANAVISQPLFTFGRMGGAEREASARIAFERAALRSSEAETLFNAIRAYILVLRDRSGIDIFAEDLALVQREYADNDARFAKREVTSSDVQQVETRVFQSQAQVYSARGAAASSAAEFLAAVGNPAADTLGPPKPLPQPVRTLEEAYAYAELHSPVLAAAYARERVSRAGVDLARAEMLPRVDLKGRAAVAPVSAYSDKLRSTELRAQVVISGPLYESGLRRAKLSEATAANDADWRLIDQALRDNRAEIAAAWNDWLVQSASIEELAKSALAARAAYEGALLQEKAGLRTTLDVLNLGRELLSSRVAYNNATAGAYIAQARLLAAMGALELDRLLPDAARYDPDAHYDRTKNDGEFPVIPAFLRGVDKAFTSGETNRPLRDPAAPAATPGVKLPVPKTP